uniref:Uncharacterized protein n=1 Tax=Anguilla anguilla TaxID=7936 RepID=A0A0E9VV81_ANGAN
MSLSFGYFTHCLLLSSNKVTFGKNEACALFSLHFKFRPQKMISAQVLCL